MKYWCTICDNYQVNSEDDITGSFHSVSGHEVGNPTNYTMVQFALCVRCQGKLEEYTNYKQFATS